MSAMTGIVAGLATAAGAFALYRYAERRARALRRAVEERRRDPQRAGKPVLDFERDPETGVYRSK
ncbi:hypothetical protein [Amphiplicatus metriothermophilus]|uniref:Uncharacterized protein n=1 Tax=Amphiplicatus metriothermophilus TaxID=1519374 RepID=A0A239PJB0_9PROT|nr:hypothetical protein [Amphiplicatus metriothermophilus]MBB5518016.1 peptidoglycan/LPS O-acetylase OafA/YrhL [Amphiplicatus metriothermophilus]SNT67650.1 hypothetical protein SAMN06297382_0142 [Amphiplicatus metriothermophilus]